MIGYVWSHHSVTLKKKMRHRTAAPVPAVPVLGAPQVNPHPSSLWCSQCNNLHHSQSILNKKSQKGMYKCYLHKYFLNFTIPIDQAMIGAVFWCRAHLPWCHLPVSLPNIGQQIIDHWSGRCAWSELVAVWPLTGNWDCNRLPHGILVA